MKFLTIDQVKGLGADVVKIVMGFVGALVALKLLSSGDAATIQASLDQLNKSVAEIGAVIATLITVWTTLRTVWANSPLSLMLRGSTAAVADPSSVQGAPLADQKIIVQGTDKLPQVVGIVADPAIANSAPEHTIVPPTHAKELSQ